TDEPFLRQVRPGCFLLARRHESPTAVVTARHACRLNDLLHIQPIARSIALLAKIRQHYEALYDDRVVNSRHPLLAFFAKHNCSEVKLTHRRLLRWVFAVESHILTGQRLLSMAGASSLPLSSRTNILGRLQGCFRGPIFNPPPSFLRVGTAALPPGKILLA